MIAENVSTFKIHRLTQEQYDKASKDGNIEKDAFYLTPDASNAVYETDNKILDYITYEIVEDESGNKTVTITGCDTSISGEHIIPDTIEGYPVTTLGTKAFMGCVGLISIVIPDTVTLMKDKIFQKCSNLTRVTLSCNLATIELGTFNLSGLTSIVIPESVSEIKKGAFQGCHNLTNIIIPNSVTQIGEQIFYSCSQLTNVALPNSIETIPALTFMDCLNLTTVTIPTSVKQIGAQAFHSSDNLKDVYYEGTEEQWNDIFVDSHNDGLSKATIHYNQALANKDYVDNGKIVEAQGESIFVNDVSPIEHELKVEVPIKNLFNNTLYINPNTYRRLYNGYYYSDYIQLKPNTTYTISTTNNEFVESALYYVLGIDGEEGAARYIYPINNGTPENLTFTTKTSGLIEFGVSTNNGGIEANLSKIFSGDRLFQLEEGSIATAYTPYIDLSTVEVSKYGKNLCSGAPINLNSMAYNDGVYIQTADDTKGYLELVIQKYKGIYTFVSAIASGIRVEEPKVLSYTFTKDDTFDALRVGHNGSVRNVMHYLDVSHLTNGVTYTIQINFTNVTQGSFSWQDIQIEAGDTATEYESYIVPQTATPTADGTVEGLTSISPNMALFTNTEGVQINCKYYKRQAIDELIKEVFATKKYVNELVQSSIPEVGYYYATLSGAVADVNNNTIGVNIDADKETAVASVRIENGEKVVTLLKDTTETTTIPAKTDMTLDLNGKCIEFGAGAKIGVNSENITLTILGETRGSKISKSIEEVTVDEMLCLAAKGTIKAIGGEYIVYAGSSTGNYLNVFWANRSGNLDLIKCKIYAEALSGNVDVSGINNMGANSNIEECQIEINTNTNGTGYGIFNQGTVEIKNTKIFADGLPGAGDSTYKGTSMGILNTGTIKLMDCEAYGVDSGLREAGDSCDINGGSYDGVQHGGIFIWGTGSENPRSIYIENANISAAQYKGNNKAAYTHINPNTGMSVGDGKNMSIYLDNCIIKGGNIYTITISDTNNSVYMSNCTIDKNTTNFTTSDEIANNIIGLTQSEIDAMNAEEGDDKTLPRNVIRIDSSVNKLCLGKGNNFKRNHLLVHRPVDAYDDINTVIENTDKIFYIRELVETTTE